MPSLLVSSPPSRPETATFLVPSELQRVVEELFPRADALLPRPYKIYPADETQPPVLGFPLADTPVMRDLDARLDRWLADEVVWQIGRQAATKEKAQLSLGNYMSALMRAAENALVSNLLNDYHAVFWLAHSFDLARQFSSVPRRVAALGTQAARAQGDALKYRIYSRWAADTRDQMTQLAAKASAILDGEEQRGLQFFRLLQDDVLIL